MAAGAREGRRHRRVRRRARSVEPEHRVRRTVAGPTSAVGARERRAGQQPARLA
jgi:hypothetical protein